MRRTARHWAAEYIVRHITILERSFALHGEKSNIPTKRSKRVFRERRYSTGGHRSHLFPCVLRKRKLLFDRCLA